MRFYYKGGKLTPLQVERLEGIGFQWNLAESLWEKRKNDLVAYKERTGTFDVPHSEDPALHQWANNQKKMFNEKRLQQDKIDRLAEIGFDVEESTPKKRSVVGVEATPTKGAAGGESWEKRFMELVEYNNEFGHCIVSAILFAGIMFCICFYLTNSPWFMSGSRCLQTKSSTGELG